MTQSERLAKLFHTTYEAFAPLHGYETRPESRTAWEDVPEQNRSLMIAVCESLLRNQCVTLRSDLIAECDL